MADKNGVTKDVVMKALGTVMEPELHRDLVTLNMIKDLKINGPAVELTVVLTTPACPLRNVIERDVRAAVGKVSGVKSVNVKWDANVPTDRRISAGQLSLPMKNTVAVASGKGGVGKTTVAVNLAVVLAQAGASVGLLDADIYGPNVPMMMGVEAMPSPTATQMRPAIAHGVKVMSMAFLVKPGQPLIWRGPMLHSAIRQFLSDVDWGELDYLLIDLPPGTGDAQLSLTQSLPLTGGLIVTLPQAVSQADALRGLEMFRTMKVPVLGVIENMSYLITPMGERVDVFGQGGGRALAERAGVPFIGEIPLDPHVRIGGDAGAPIVLSHPDSPVAQAFKTIGQDVAAKVSVQTLMAESNLIPIQMIG
ncbi:MAG: Mrp/NBP35 family ATP-binding protein [Chloroflexi bacterium]|nr:Mrp/NBP35 family ATP-binding protein [Chloroflexota bacterium]